jgi:hypothetical protein
LDQHQGGLRGNTPTTFVADGHDTVRTQFHRASGALAVDGFAEDPARPSAQRLDPARIHVSGPVAGTDTYQREVEPAPEISEHVISALPRRRFDTDSDPARAQIPKLGNRCSNRIRAHLSDLDDRQLARPRHGAQ